MKSTSYLWSSRQSRCLMHWVLDSWVAREVKGALGQTTQPGKEDYCLALVYICIE